MSQGSCHQIRNNFISSQKPLNATVPSGQKILPDRLIQTVQSHEVAFLNPRDPSYILPLAGKDLKYIFTIALKPPDKSLS